MRKCYEFTRRMRVPFHSLTLTWLSIGVHFDRARFENVHLSIVFTALAGFLLVAVEEQAFLIMLTYYHRNAPNYYEFPSGMRVSFRWSCCEAAASDTLQMRSVLALLHPNAHNNLTKKHFKM